LAGGDLLAIELKGGGTLRPGLCQDRRDDDCRQSEG
jgi:hypothetical protein